MSRWRIGQNKFHMLACAQPEAAMTIHLYRLLPPTSTLMEFALTNNRNVQTPKRVQMYAIGF